MGLRFDPVGGGQFKQAVQAMVEAEKQPIKALESRKANEEARLKLFQDFKGRFAGITKALGDFTSLRKFRELKAELGDGTSLMNVSLDKDKAEPGTYQLEVLELAERSSIISNAMEDPDSPALGMGYIRMKFENGDSREILVEEKNSSLKGVAALINSEIDSPVKASVIKDGTDPDKPWRLLISAKKDGADNSITFPQFYFLDGAQDFYVEENHDAQNALIKLNGFEIETGGNQVPDFLTGVSVELKAAKPGTSFTMTVSEDYNKVSGKVKGLVDELNKVLEFINKQNQIDQSSDTRSTFAGDTSLQNIEFQIRNLVHNRLPVLNESGELVRSYQMSELGVEFEKTGLLTFKEDKFKKALERDFDGIGQAITGPNGFGQMLSKAFDGYTRSGSGILANRESGMRQRIKEIDNQIDFKSRNIERRVQTITDQFSRLQGTLSNMQRQGQYLSATLGGGGGGSMIGQLLGG
ncbi:MAG: flagellar filament capping protein FliD [Bdellovibrionales bacterium]|nr:flagellar filament capping protein FliD [Bdellovibrionales bacterium]